MPKISALPPMTSPDAADEAPIVDTSTTSTKKWTLTLLKTYLQSLASWVTTAMINAAAVTPAKWTNPYKFSVYRSASQSVVNGTPTKINFDTELYDSNNNFNNSTTYRYVAPVNGFYRFDAAVEGTTASGGFSILYLYKNGVNLKQLNKIYIGTATGAGAGSGTEVQLAAGDYVEIFLYLTGTSVVVGAPTAWFTGHLISET